MMEAENTVLVRVPINAQFVIGDKVGCTYSPGLFGVVVGFKDFQTTIDGEVTTRKTVAVKHEDPTYRELDDGITLWAPTALHYYEENV